MARVNAREASVKTAPRPCVGIFEVRIFLLNGRYLPAFANY